MSAIGDYEEADAYDREPPEPEQVAYKLHRLAQAVRELVGAPAQPWDDLSPQEQAQKVYLATAFVSWALTHPAPNAYEAARILHEIARTRTGAPSWDELSGDERAIAVDLMGLVIAWLMRQGALE